MWYMSLLNAFPNRASVSWDVSTRSFTLRPATPLGLNDWSCVSLSFSIEFPFSSIDVCATIPRGATSHPLISKAASRGSGSCQPLEASSFSMDINFASWPRADL